MSKIILYGMTLSPPCRAIQLVAKALNIELEFVEVDLSKREHLTPEFLKMNPQHTIPTLDDNGVYLYDSHAICTYLCEKYGKNDKLYPKDIVKRALVDARLHFNSGFLFARLRFMYEPIFIGEESELSQVKLDYFAKCFGLLEAFLENGDYLCGNDLTVADFACISTISSADQFAPIDEKKYPKLQGWLNRMAQIPYYNEITIEAAKNHQNYIKFLTKKA